MTLRASPVVFVTIRAGKPHARFDRRQGAPNLSSRTG
jgi:hypothetical protein